MQYRSDFSIERTKKQYYLFYAAQDMGAAGIYDGAFKAIMKQEIDIDSKFNSDEQVEMYGVRTPEIIKSSASSKLQNAEWKLGQACHLCEYEQAGQCSPADKSQFRQAIEETEVRQRMYKAHKDPDVLTGKKTVHCLFYTLRKIPNEAWDY